MKLSVSQLVLVALSMSLLSARADTIHMKSGKKLDGVVKQETKTHIVLDLGVGSLTIPREQVASIDRTGASGNEEIKDAWKRKYFLHKQNIPKGLEDLAAGYRRLAQTRSGAVGAQKDLAVIERQESRLRADAVTLESDLVDLSRTLEQLTVEEDVKKYNAAVTARNKLVSRATILQAARRKLDERRKKALTGIGNYMELLSKFETEFATRERQAKERAERVPAAHFFDGVSGSLRAWSGEFSGVAVATSSSLGGTIVSVLVNGRAKGRFVLDTGATYVTISESFARRAAVKPDSQETIRLVMADGREVVANRVVLSSVQLGKAREERVPAVILNPTQKGDIDGLLGMSFLENFVIHLDGASGKLILRKFAPSSESGR